jgi:EAL domain-containing protein (putative c-di-GMP-specific phosphodiesterase class I)
MMGNSLNLKIIAEGIEHLEQLDSLQRLGCESGQGSYFAKPLSKNDMDMILFKTNLNKNPRSIAK